MSGCLYFVRSNTKYLLKDLDVKVDNPLSPLVGKLEGLHLFHFDGAPCAQRVRFALYEKDLVRGREVRFDADDAASVAGEPGRWVSRQVSLVKRQHMTATYAAIHPNLVVPALVHDGQLHLESMDIIEYLDEAFGGVPLVPKDNARLADARALTTLGEELHRSIRFVTFRWGLRGLARLSTKDEAQLKDALKNGSDGEQLLAFYEGYDSRAIPEEVFVAHLEKLNRAFKDLEARLEDGRAFLTGSALTMADVIWAMKILRLTECDYPFERCFPAVHAWFTRVASRRAFVEGVMGKHRVMSNAFRFKARLEKLMGIGLRSEVLQRVA